MITSINTYINTILYLHRYRLLNTHLCMPVHAIMNIFLYANMQNNYIYIYKFIHGYIYKTFWDIYIYIYICVYIYIYL